jgi:hypothetical protein
MRFLYRVKVVRFRVKKRFEVDDLEAFKHRLISCVEAFKGPYIYDPDNGLMTTGIPGVEHGSLTLEYAAHEEGGKRYVDLEIEVKCPHWMGLSMARTIAYDVLNAVSAAKKQAEGGSAEGAAAQG